MVEVKRTFLLVGVLYHLLCRWTDEPYASRVASAFLFDLADAVQRSAYFPSGAQERSWDRFHDLHGAQIADGFIRFNENDGVVRTPHVVSMHITRCRFFEAFRDMGNASLVEAFCRSDEAVFNDYLPEMRFHRGDAVANTIARGAKRCTFIFEKSSD